MDFTCERLSEDTWLLRFADIIDPAVNARVHALARALRRAALPGLVDIAPAYSSLLLRWDSSVDSAPGDPERMRAILAEATDGAMASVFMPPHPTLSPESVRGRGLARGTATTHDSASDWGASGYGLTHELPLPHAASSHGGKGWGEGASATRSDRSRCAIEIPVCYDRAFGPDLDIVASHAGLSGQAVIERHTAATYTVAMLGFAPGFPYLLGLDPTLQVPRRANPRTRVPAGSVAIGGAQTGIYSQELPGGWHLIGRTPLRLFDPLRDQPALLAPGDRVRFRPIGAEEFTALAARAS